MLWQGCLGVERGLTGGWFLGLLGTLGFLGRFPRGWIGIRKLPEGTIKMGVLEIGQGRLGFGGPCRLLGYPNTKRPRDCFVRIGPRGSSFFIWEFRLKNHLKLWDCKFASNLAVWLVPCFCTLLLEISFLLVWLVLGVLSFGPVSLFVAEVAQALLMSIGVV